MNNDVFGSGTGSSEDQVPVQNLSYEAAREELVQTVKLLEMGQMGLDESLALWERGEALARRCEEHLAGARAKVEKSLQSRDGNHSTAQNGNYEGGENGGMDATQNLPVVEG